MLSTREILGIFILLFTLASCEDANREAQMRHAMMEADAQNKAYIDFTTDSVMKQVAEYYDHHGNANDRMRAHYLLGCTYRDMGDAPAELECFQKAVESADTGAQDCDFYVLTAIYGQMANIYDRQYLPDEELKVLKQVEKYSYLCGDSISAIQAYALRIRPYHISGKSNSVLYITNRARQLFLEHHDTINAARYLCPAISIYINQKKWEKASELISFFEKESGYFHNNKKRQDGIPPLYYYYKGMLLLHSGDVTAAINTFRLLSPFDEKEAMCKGLLEAYIVEKKSDSIAKYARMYAAYNDSSSVKKSQQTIERMTAMFNYDRHRIIAEQQTNVANKAKHSLWFTLTITTMVILCLVVGICLVIFAYQKKEAKQKMRHDILIRSYNNAIKKLRELEKTHTEETSSDTLTNEIQELREEITRLKAFDTDIEFNAWFETFYNAPVVDNLRQKAIKIQPNSNILADKDTLDKLSTHYQENASVFYQAIRSHDYKLNNLDEIVVMLTVLDFSGKDIAVLMARTPQQISNTRQRVYRKMFPSGNNVRNLRKELLLMLHNMQFASSPTIS